MSMVDAVRRTITYALIEQGWSLLSAEDGIDALEAEAREKALHDAVEAVRAEFLHESLDNDEDRAYMNGLRDAVGAIGLMCNAETRAALRRTKDNS